MDGRVMIAAIRSLKMKRIGAAVANEISATSAHRLAADAARPRAADA